MHERGEITDEYYESIVQIRSMSEEDWKEIVKDYNNGNLDKEQYEAMKQIREMPDDWRTLENGLKGITNGTANGLWEGVQWYLGGKLGDFAIQGHKILSSSVRVGIDSAFNAADTPYRAFIDAATSDGNFDAAWANQGGWESVLSNLAVGLVGSVGGEIFDNVKLNKDSINLKTNEVLDDLDDFSKKFPNSLDAQSRKLQDALQTAEYFSDFKGYLANVLGIEKIGNMTEADIYGYAQFLLTSKPEQFRIFESLYNKGEINKIVNMSNEDIYKYVSQNLSEEEFKVIERLYMNLGTDEFRYLTDNEIYKLASKKLGKDNFKNFKTLYKNRRELSQQEKDLILVFAAHGGPAVEAYCRGTEIEFLGRKFDGANYSEMDDYFQRSIYAEGNPASLDGVHIDEAVKILDNIIENSTPLTESLTVSRYVDDIFVDGDRILNPQVGMVFNDKAFFSTSASGGVYKDRKIKLEIEIPAGSKVAYIEPEAMPHTSFGQQEVLLGRNNSYQIKDILFDENTGQIIIKAEMIPAK